VFLFFLEQNVEGFIRHNARWFLSHGRSYPSDDKAESYDFHNKYLLWKKFQALLEVCPSVLNHFLYRLTQEEEQIFYSSLFERISIWKTSKYTEQEVFSQERFPEVKILEDLYRFKGERWIRNQTEKVKEDSLEEEFITRILVLIKGGISDSIKEIFLSYLFEDIKEIAEEVTSRQARIVRFSEVLSMEELRPLEKYLKTVARELQSKTYRLSKVLSKDIMIKELEKLKKKDSSKEFNELLESIKEEVKSNTIKKPTPEEKTKEEIEKENLDRWQDLIKKHKEKHSLIQLVPSNYFALECSS